MEVKEIMAEFDEIVERLKQIDDLNLKPLTTEQILERLEQVQAFSKRLTQLRKELELTRIRTIN